MISTFCPITHNYPCVSGDQSIAFWYPDPRHRQSSPFSNTEWSTWQHTRHWMTPSIQMIIKRFFCQWTWRVSEHMKNILMFCISKTSILCVTSTVSINIQNVGEDAIQNAIYRHWIVQCQAFSSN